MPSEKGKPALLQGTLELIGLRLLASLGPQPAYAIATRLLEPGA